MAFLLRLPKSSATLTGYSHSSRKFTSRMVSQSAALLLSPKELQNLAKAGADVVALDSSWFIPGIPRQPKEEFKAKRLPMKTAFFDLDEVASTHELGLKHMMPSTEQFARACEKYGISSSTHVVLYDTYGIFSSPRALFTFRAFGHANSSVLNGGLPGWEAEGLPIDTSKRTTTDNTQANVSYPVPKLDSTAIRSYDEVITNAEKDPSMDSTAELVLDARPSGRFTGVDPEPRPGLSSGHIPHSFSVPFGTFLNKHTTSVNGSEQTYTTFKSREEVLAALQEVLGAKNLQEVLEGKRRITTSCGSGMTAGVLWLGLQLLGVNSAIYDESWTGYVARSSSKIVKDI